MFQIFRNNKRVGEDPHIKSTFFKPELCFPLGKVAYIVKLEFNFILQQFFGLSIVRVLAGQSTPPVMTIAGVENRTREYVDTKNLTDKMRTMLLKSGKMQFVNTARRTDLLNEQGYQAANANPEQMATIGAQAGAKYMITGSLTQMTQQTGKQVRVSKQRLNYYKLTMEITDLTSSLIVWTTEEEFARNESIPLIGW